jgi:hypothetical protein
MIQHYSHFAGTIRSLTPSLEGQASLFFRAFFLTVIDYPSPAAHLGGY